MNKKVFMRWFWCLLEYLMVCPIILVIAGFSLPEAAVVPLTVVLPLHTLFSIFITSVLKKFRNILIAVIGLIYITGFSWLWALLFQFDNIGGFFVVGVGTALLFIYGFRTGVAANTKESYFYAVGLIIHAGAVLLTGQAPPIMKFQNAAIVLAVFYVLAGLPMANRRFLMCESQQKSSLSIIPGTVLRGNRIILFILLAGTIVLSFWETLLNGIVYIAQKIVDLIIKFLLWLTSFNEFKEQPPEGSGQMELPPGESNPAVSTILDILSYLLVLTILFFFIRYIVKNHKRILGNLYAAISAFFNRFHKWSATEQGYVDRQESLLKTEAPKRVSFLKRLFNREPKWRDMKDNTSRIRFLYTRFVLDHMKKGFHFNPSETPAETVDRIQDMEKGEAKDHNDLRNAYQQVRYGDKQVDNETVKVLKGTYH